MNVSSGNPAHHSVSIFLTLSIIIFIVSLGGAGFAYAWQRVLNSEQVQYKDDLAKDQNQFNTDLINTLTAANTKIDVAKSLIKNHLATSEIFNIISQLTIASVEWKSFSFTAPSVSGASANAAGTPSDVTISMQGEADSYYSVAYQSDVLGNSSQFGSNDVIKNPVLSNLSVGSDGKVGFSFTASVDPSELSYVSELSSQSATSASASTTLPVATPTVSGTSSSPLTR
ncbi:MAG: hypothetical protein P4L61_01835 [Candidatus Pacebacteria bacterium]|nr:hypothetical protein [Candidatus Paceibacterota bacterium]